MLLESYRQRELEREEESCSEPGGVRREIDTDECMLTDWKSCSWSLSLSLGLLTSDGTAGSALENRPSVSHSYKQVEKMERKLPGTLNDFSSTL